MFPQLRQLLSLRRVYLAYSPEVGGKADANFLQLDCLLVKTTEQSNRNDAVEIILENYTSSSAATPLPKDGVWAAQSLR